MLKIFRPKEVALLLAAFFLHSSSFAASFDCSVSSTARERLICSDQALSHVDEQLGRAYLGTLAGLSPRGEKLLQTSQRSWLHFLETVCPVPRRTATTDTEIVVQCLQREYDARLEQLASARTTRGPYTFIRVDVFAASQDNEDNTGSRTGFQYEHLAYPQIDSPDSATTQVWNDYVAKQLPIPGGCEGPADDDLDYELGMASPRFISLAWPGMKATIAMERRTDFSDTVPTTRFSCLVEEIYCRPISSSPVRNGRRNSNLFYGALSGPRAGYR